MRETIDDTVATLRAPLGGVRIGPIRSVSLPLVER